MTNPFAPSRPTVAPMLVSEPEAARILGIGARTLWELRARGRIPFVQIGTSIRYDVADLRAFIEATKTRASAKGVTP